jgi:hypothetical protein
MSDDNSRLPNPRAATQHPPLMELSFAALGWLNRTAQAVGSDRFAELVNRTEFYLDRAEEHVFTPAEQAVIEGMRHGLGLLLTVNAQARTLLAESCSDMLAADAAEFVELVEGAPEGD